MTAGSSQAGVDRRYGGAEPGAVRARAPRQRCPGPDPPQLRGARGRRRLLDRGGSAARDRRARRDLAFPRAHVLQGHAPVPAGRHGSHGQADGRLQQRRDLDGVHPLLHSGPRRARLGRGRPPGRSPRRSRPSRRRAGARARRREGGDPAQGRFASRPPLHRPQRGRLREEPLRAGGAGNARFARPDRHRGDARLVALELRRRPDRGRDRRRRRRRPGARGGRGALRRAVRRPTRSVAARAPGRRPDAGGRPHGGRAGISGLGVRGARPGGPRIRSARSRSGPRSSETGRRRGSTAG